jgi:hypothetical protein
MLAPASTGTGGAGGGGFGVEGGAVGGVLASRFALEPVTAGSSPVRSNSQAVQASAEASAHRASQRRPQGVRQGRGSPFT